MRIVADTREQEPYSFDLPVVRRALPAGDYSVEGLETRVAVERKSLDDFVQTVIRGRKRFRNELLKLEAYDAAIVVVECDFSRIVSGQYRSGAHPNSVVGSIISIIQDYGIPVFFCSDRQHACRFTEEYLTRFANKAAPCDNQQAPCNQQTPRNQQTS
jgi:ERCC4-type nuclease